MLGPTRTRRKIRRLRSSRRRERASGVVRFLCEAGADKDNAVEKWTPLIAASRKGYLELLQFLCEAGADRGMRAKNGLTPLSVAEHRGHLDVLRCLRQVACRLIADGAGGDDDARLSQRGR